MNNFKYNLKLDIFDYSGRKICPLYDSSLDVDGQATNVVISTSRNGWKELSFTLPSVCVNEVNDMNSGDTPTENYRQQYLKADYRIRAIDDDGTDWFLISEPKVVHQAFSKNITVTAGHVSQLLKTKNLGLEFSDDEGNNVGTARELLETILAGSGWTPGNVADFYEKDGTTIKKRTLVASSKTGAFKLISSMCDLFDAKPVFHGDAKTVDVQPMNPFSKPTDGGLPDVASADTVLELHYGKNLSNVTRTQNTENLVTKLYAYGSYGDKTHGYCGIDECKHTEHKIVLTQALQAGQTYWFSVISDANMRIYRNITPKTNIASGTTLIWSMLDPVSMSYLWQSNTNTAHAVKIGQAGTEMKYSVTATDVQNWFSFLMDFTYYQDVELLNDDMLQIIAAYQRNAPEQYQIVNAEAANFAKALTDLSNIIGSVDYCKLSVSSVGTDGGYIKLNLNSAYKNGVIYRSDYAKKEDDYFEWNVADALNTKGDPTNDVASVVYVIHKTTPVTWDKVFIKSFDDKENIGALTLWNAARSLKLNASTDQFFLFATNNVNGKLGALEISDEANLQALASATKIVTTPHHVYFSETAPSISNLNGYGWWWKYSASGAASQMYFCYRDNGDTNWKRVYVTNTQPSVADAYWFDWSKSVLYKGGSSWEAFTEDAAAKIASYFGTVQRYGTARDQLYHGVYQKYTHTVSSALPAGNYYMESDYDTYWVFTTTEALAAGDSLTYNTDDGWITQTRSGIESTVEVKGYRFDNVMHDSANEITIDEEKYQRLNVTSRSGDIKGIVAYMEKFPALSDAAYLDAYRKYKAASDSLTAMENELSETLGDLYREGWWQSNDYVDGDEDKLYDDALENLKKIAQPEATYEVSYLHLRGANRDMEYAASYESDMIDWPEVTPSSAIHLIDEEIAVNVWAYVDQLNKCYDIPQKSKLAINTNLTTMAQHSFTDVLTNIADVASRIKGKTSIYDRASALSSYGTLGTSSLEGAIDAAKLQLLGGASTWYTDANGNMVFVSADGSAAMTLTGNGFCIANSKDADGDWNWRTFGTGDGFTADLITAGLIRADRIEAGSIGASKLASDVTNEIDKISGITGWITETELKLEPGRIASEVIKTAEFEGKQQDAVAGITNGQTFIQYNMPVGTFQVGDVWIKTSKPDMVWNILKSKTWQEIKGDIWGNFGTTETPITHVWDGTSWLVTSDFSFVTEMRTSIEQTAEKIESVASRTESINGELKETKTIVTQTADGIKSLATKEELEGTKTSILEQTAEAISALVENDEGMQSQINQQANSIQTLVDNGKGMQSQINQQAGQISTLVKSDEGIRSQIDQQANQISTLVKSDEGMQSQINQQATSIQTLVTNGNGMQSQINQQATSIQTLVDNGNGMQSQINQQATQISTLVTNGNDMQSKINQQAGQIDMQVESKDDPASSVETTSVSINTSGVKIKTGGTFTVDSQKFDINENGEMSATNARISGQLSVNGHDVWHKGNIIVLTTPPSNPTPGTIWVKPDMSSIPAAGTWSHEALSSRPWSNNYVVELNGTSIGAAPGNATYTYEVSVPVYYSHNKTGTCTCTVYLGATSGAKTISMGTQSFTANNAGGNTYTATVTSTTWLGNTGKIYLLVVFSNGNLMTVNSYEAFTCTLMAKSTTGASGWKACEVQMYIG